MNLIKDLQKLLEADDPNKEEETQETPEDETSKDEETVDDSTDETSDESSEEEQADSNDEDDSGVTDADEVPVEDIGSVATVQGFKKSKKEMYAFGKTRPVTLLMKDEPLGGLDLTLQYVINPATGAWKLRACLAGQSEEDMVEFDSGEDPSSLIKNLKKKNKITPHQAVEHLNPPADKAVKNDESVTESKEDDIEELKAQVRDLDRAIMTLEKGRGMHQGRIDAQKLRKKREELKDKIAKLEKLKESVDAKEYVVIGNAGRARGQTLWPSTDMPDLFTKAEADKIAKEQNDSEKKSARPGYQMHWHVQHLDDAHKYVTGRAATSIQNLKDTAFGDYDDEE